MNRGRQGGRQIRRRMRVLTFAMETMADAAAAREGSMLYGETGWLSVLDAARREAEAARKIFVEAGMLPSAGNMDEEPQRPLSHVFTAQADMRRSFLSLSPFWDRRRERAVEFIRSGERAGLERALGLDPAWERAYEEQRAGPDAELGGRFRSCLQREGGREAVEGRYYRMLRVAYDRRREEYDRLAARVGCAMAVEWNAATHERAATMIATQLALDMARTAAPLAMQVRETARRMQEEVEKDLS